MKWVICEVGGTTGPPAEKNELDTVNDYEQYLQIAPSVCIPKSHPAMLMPARRGNGRDRLTISGLVGIGAAKACNKHGSQVRAVRNDRASIVSNVAVEERPKSLESVIC